MTICYSFYYIRLTKNVFFNTQSIEKNDLILLDKSKRTINISLSNYEIVQSSIYNIIIFVTSN